MNPRSETWTLHPQLQRDSIVIGDLPLSHVLLIDDANFPWLLLVPRVPGAVEIIDLPEGDRAQLMTEIALVSGVLKELTECDKLNVAALGNVVPQLHVHIVARRHIDAAWPKPVWNSVAAVPYRREHREGIIVMLRDKLGLIPK